MLNVHSIETFGTHDGPGIRMVLFLQGCPFRCVYCHNPDTQALQTTEMKHYSSDQVIELLEKERPYFQHDGGLTVSGGEPTIQAEALIELFKKAKVRGFHLALDTCGAFFSKEVNQLYDLTDVVILDVKHINPEWHQKVTKGNLANVLKNAAYREKSGKLLWLRYVLVPGWTDQPQYVEEWAKYFSKFQTLQRVEILPYHTLGQYKYEALGRKSALEGVQPPTQQEIENCKRIFEKYLKNVVIN